MTPAQVVFVTHNYPRHPGDVSGTFLHPLARALVNGGWPVTVVAPADRGGEGAAASECRDGVRIRRVTYAAPARETLAYEGSMISHAATPSGFVALVRLHRALRRAAREEMASRPSVVHAHWWVPGGLAAPPEASTLLTVHGTDGRLLERSAAARWMARPVFHRVRVVTAVSGELARIVERATGRHVPLGRVIPMPVDTERWPWSAGGGGIVVLGRLTEQKRVGLAIEAVVRLAAQGRTVPLRILGDGPARDGLTALAGKIGPRVPIEFLGMVPPDRVPGYLAVADLCVMPAVGEGLGLAAAEALMAGVPVIACEDGGGLLDVVPRHGAGRIVDPTGTTVAAGIVEMLDAGQDAQVAARRLGTEWRERLRPARIAERFTTLYTEALGG